MAYSKKEKEDLLKKAIKAATDNNLYFIEEIVAYLPISTKTFYEWKLQESNELKDVIETNKIETKSKLRNKWAESSNATLNIALYKLIGTSEERRILADREETAIPETDIPKDIDNLTPQQVDEYYNKLRAN